MQRHCSISSLFLNRLLCTVVLRLFVPPPRRTPQHRRQGPRAALLVSCPPFGSVFLGGRGRSETNNPQNLVRVQLFHEYCYSHFTKASKVNTQAPRSHAGDCGGTKKNRQRQTDRNKGLSLVGLRSCIFAQSIDLTPPGKAAGLTRQPDEPVVNAD